MGTMTEAWRIRCPALISRPFPQVASRLFAAEQDQIVHADLGHETLFTVGFVDAVHELAFDRDFIAFLEVFLGNARELSPDDNVVPLSVLNLLTFLILVGVGGRQGKSSLLFPLIESFYFGIFSQSANELDTVS